MLREWGVPEGSNPAAACHWPSTSSRPGSSMVVQRTGCRTPVCRHAGGGFNQSCGFNLPDRQPRALPTICLTHGQPGGAWELQPVSQQCHLLRLRGSTRGNGGPVTKQDELFIRRVRCQMGETRRGCAGKLSCDSGRVGACFLCSSRCGQCFTNRNRLWDRSMGVL